MIPRFDDLVINRAGARFRGQKLPCAIGRGGIAMKQGEGDGITPVGIFRLAQIHYRPDRLQISLPARAIPLNGIWSDDPRDPAYNHALRSYKHPFSHERLRRADPLYDAFGVLTYNWPHAIPGKGSAIFMHVWRKPGHPTEGCIAFSRNDLLYIFSNWRPTSRVIIQG